MSQSLTSGGNLPPGPRSKYRRSRHPLIWVVVIIGLVIGIGGGLYYAWVANPTEEFDTEPWQLRPDDRAHYMVAIVLEYAYDGDLNRAVQRLVLLRPPGDPIQEVADVACRLATSGYVSSSSGLRAIRAMITFYQLQGRAGCADTLIPAGDQPTPAVVIELPSPTPVPPASKTPTPESGQRATPTRSAAIVPTSPPQRDFVLANITTDCSTTLSGLIEVFVQDFNGEGIPGMEVRVRWDEGEDSFYTGLKPERGPAYADFQMEAGKSYVIEMPGRSDPSTRPLAAAPCTTAAGQPAITLYRVVFRPAE